MDEATRRHRAGAVPEEQDGDLSSDGSKMADADELVFVHAPRLSNSRATPPASQFAASTAFSECRKLGERSIAGQSSGRMHPPVPGSNPGRRLDSWPVGAESAVGERFERIGARVAREGRGLAPSLRSSAPMQLSRFVVA